MGVLVLVGCSTPESELAGSLTYQLSRAPGSVTPSPRVDAGDPDLVAWYRFEETGPEVLDSSGNANHGSPSTTLPRVPGRFGKGIHSEKEISNSVTIPDSTSLQLRGSVTLEAWMNYDSFRTDPGRYVIFAKGTSMGGATHSGLGLAFDESTRTLVFLHAGLSAPSSEYRWADVNPAAPKKPEVGAWTHFAATYDGAQAILFINGVEVRNVGQTGTLAPTTDPLMIWSINSTINIVTRPIGKTDEVMIWRIARTGRQICEDAGGVYSGLACELKAPPPAGENGVGTITLTRGSKVSGTFNLGGGERISFEAPSSGSQFTAQVVAGTCSATVSGTLGADEASGTFSGTVPLSGECYTLTGTWTAKRAGAGTGGGGGSTCGTGLRASTSSCTPLGSGGVLDTCVTKAEYESVFAGMSLPASCAAANSTRCMDTQKGALVAPCCPGLTCKVGSACGGGSTFGGVCLQ